MGFESNNSTPKNKTEILQADAAENDSEPFNYGSASAEDSGQESLTPSENITASEQWQPEEATVEYEARNEDIAQKLTTIENKLNTVHDYGHDLDEAQIDTLLKERALLKQEKIYVSANYPGDWTSLLYKRLSDPSTKEKFIARRNEAMQYMEDDPSNVGRREKSKTHYQDQIDNYDTNIERVFSMTQVGPAEAFGSKQRNLGNMGNVGVGAVFTNAEHEGSPLSNRQKNIIEAHEKGHCLRDFVSPHEKKEIQSAINRDTINELNALRQENGIDRIAPTYVSDPMEIVERMAQFKNYFGMGAADTFTKQHLDHIRKHYVADTGLDNGVSDLLYVVTPETEEAFLKIINKYPI